MTLEFKDPHSKTKDTYTKLGEPYLEEISKGGPPELHDFVKLFPKGSTILDVGTAGGRDAKVFVDAGMNVTGIDVVDSFLEKAKKDVPIGKFVHMDARDLDFPPGTFNGIYANASLLHLKKEEVPEVLSKFYTVLNEGGKLHIRLKQGEGEKEIAEKLSQDQSRFFAFYGKEEIEKLLQDARFKIIRSEVMSDDLGRKDTNWISIWGEK